MDSYSPIQPVNYDHGVCTFPITSACSGLNAHVLQVIRLNEVYIRRTLRAQDRSAYHWVHILGATSRCHGHPLGCGRFAFLPHLRAIGAKLLDDFVEEASLERLEKQPSHVDTGLQFERSNGGRVHTGHTEQAIR